VECVYSRIRNQLAIIRAIRVKVLFHHQRTIILLRFGSKALTQILDDLVPQFFTTAAPSPRTGELFDTTAQSAKAQHARRLTELRAQFVAQAREEKELEAVAGFTCDEAKIGFKNFLLTRFERAGANGETEIAQHFFQSAGELAHRDCFAAQFILEIVKDGCSSVTQHFGVEQAIDTADDFDGNHFRRAGHTFAVR